MTDQSTTLDLELRATEAAAHAAKLEADGAPAANVKAAKARARQYAGEAKAAKQRDKAERAARRAKPAGRDGSSLPVIEVGNEPEAVQAVIEVLEDGRITDVYLYGQKLTQVGREASGPYLVPLDSNGLTFVLMRQAAVQKTTMTKDGDPRVQDVLLPPRVASVVLSNSRWSLPALRGISSTPLLLPDGTFQCTPGYNEKTGYYYEPRHVIPDVPADPTPEQIEAAKRLILDELLADFPWKRDSDRATFVALMFYPLLRVLVDDPMMLAVLSATNPGSGKSLLTAILDAAYGTGKTTWPSDNTEMGKTITSVLATNANPVILFDNLPSGHVIRYPVLSELITSKVWSQRVLGKSEQVTVPNGRLWIANGNNLSTGDDSARRAVWCVLDPDVRPDTRDTAAFVLGDLNEWLPLHAGTVLHALLVLLAGWVSDGMPKSAHSIASFGAWPRTLGGILGWLGVDGWLENREEQMQQGDDDAQEWAGFLAVWHRHFGDDEVTSKMIHDAAQTVADQFGNSAPGPLADTIPRDGGKFVPTAKQLGHWLKGRDGRHFDEYRLRSRYDAKRKVNMWRVECTPTAVPSPRTGGQVELAV